jgi:amino acid transporter
MGELASSMPTRYSFQLYLTSSGGLYWWSHHLAAPRFRRCLCFIVGYLNTLGIVSGLCSINWGGALMLTSAVSISKDGNWTASTGQVYAVFLGIHILQGFLGSSATRILARLQNVFVFANFAIIIATFAALPAATPKEERNSAQYIFGGWNNTSGWVNGFAFIIGISTSL